MASAIAASSLLACTGAGAPPPAHDRVAPAQRSPIAAPRGLAVFERHCATCHAIGCNRVGPRLGGVVGRAAGSVADFDGYTVEMRYSGITWTPAQLDELVRAPQALVHRSWMEAIDPVTDAGQREALVDFIRRGDTSADRCPPAAPPPR
ncbi:MAG: cytochrome c family protein [Lautropia sp.]